MRSKIAVGAFLAILIVVFLSNLSSQLGSVNLTTYTPGEKVAFLRSSAVGTVDDSDLDGILNEAEIRLGLDVNNSDTDGDGVSDFDEILNGTNPHGEGSLFADVSAPSLPVAKLIMNGYLIPSSSVALKPDAPMNLYTFLSIYLPSAGYELIPMEGNQFQIVLKTAESLGLIPYGMGPATPMTADLAEKIIDLDVVYTGNLDRWQAFEVLAEAMDRSGRAGLALARMHHDLDYEVDPTARYRRPGSDFYGLEFNNAYEGEHTLYYSQKGRTNSAIYKLPKAREADAPVALDLFSDPFSLGFTIDERIFTFSATNGFATPGHVIISESRPADPEWGSFKAAHVIMGRKVSSPDVSLGNTFDATFTLPYSTFGLTPGTAEFTELVDSFVIFHNDGLVVTACIDDTLLEQVRCSANTAESGVFALFTTMCGDQFVDPATEECDDGNLSNGDGCNSMCLYEPAYAFASTHTGSLTNSTGPIWSFALAELSEFLVDAKAFVFDIVVPRLPDASTDAASLSGLTLVRNDGPSANCTQYSGNYYCSFDGATSVTDTYSGALSVDSPVLFTLSGTVSDVVAGSNIGIRFLGGNANSVVNRADLIDESFDFIPTAQDATSLVGYINETATGAVDTQLAYIDDTTASGWVEGDYLVTLSADEIFSTSCGDGIVDPFTEQCDDGNSDNTDGCNVLCDEASIVLIEDPRTETVLTPEDEEKIIMTFFLQSTEDVNLDSLLFNFEGVGMNNIESVSLYSDGGSVAEELNTSVSLVGTGAVAAFTFLNADEESGLSLEANKQEKIILKISMFDSFVFGAIPSSFVATIDAADISIDGDDLKASGSASSPTLRLLTNKALIADEHAGMNTEQIAVAGTQNLNVLKVKFSGAGEDLILNEASIKVDKDGLGSSLSALQSFNDHGVVTTIDTNPSTVNYELLTMPIADGEYFYTKVNISTIGSGSNDDGVSGGSFSVGLSSPTSKVKLTGADSGNEITVNDALYNPDNSVRYMVAGAYPIFTTHASSPPTIPYGPSSPNEIIYSFNVTNPANLSAYDITLKALAFEPIIYAYSGSTMSMQNFKLYNTNTTSTYPCKRLIDGDDLSVTTMTANNASMIICNFEETISGGLTPYNMVTETGTGFAIGPGTSATFNLMADLNDVAEFDGLQIRSEFGSIDSEVDITQLNASNQAFGQQTSTQRTDLIWLDADVDASSSILQEGALLNFVPQSIDTGILHIF